MGKNMTAKAMEANRRNAEKSTGPRTEEGKAAVSMNRLTHGLTARVPMVPGEDPAAFDTLREGLVLQLAPVGVLEEALVDRVASCTWRLWRAQRIEAGLLSYRLFDMEEDRNRKEATLEEFCRDMCKGPTEASRAWAEKKREELPTWGLVFVQECSGPGALERLNRHEAGVERSLYRALHELQRLQRERRGEDVPPPVAVDLTVNGTEASGGYGGGYAPMPSGGRERPPVIDLHPAEDQAGE